MKKSCAISLHPLAVCLANAHEATKGWLGTGVFKARNSEQELFLSRLVMLVNDRANIPEMKSIVTANEDQIAKFLEGQKLKAASVSKSDIEFYLAAMFEIILKWKQGAERDTLMFGTTEVVCSVMKGAMYYNDTLILETKSGDVAYIKMGKVNSELDLYAQVLAESQKLHKVGAETVTAHFPFVKLDLSASMDWVLGLELNPEKKHIEDHPGYKVVKALAHNILEVDNVGARVKSDVQVTFRTKGITPKARVVQISRPFMFWVCRKSCKMPIFAAYVNIDSLVK